MFRFSVAPAMILRLQLSSRWADLSLVTAKTTRERHEDEREARLQHMRDQVESGDLVVRQMTDAERRRWEEHSASSERGATPDERARRDAAKRKRDRTDARRSGTR